MNKNILIVGVVLFLIGPIVNGVFWGTSGGQIDEIGGGLFGFAAFIGLILIIVGAIKGEGRPRGGQQQQQQVVVYAQPGAGAQQPQAAMNLRCRTCNTLNESFARYCMECGHEIGAPRGGVVKGRAKKG